LRVKLTVVLAVLLSVFLAGCALFGITSAPENLRARNFALDAVHDLEVGNGPGLANRMAPAYRDQSLAQFNRLRLYLPKGPISGAQVVSSTSTNVTRSGKAAHYDRYTIEVSGNHEWAFVRCEVESGSMGMTMNAFYVQKMYVSYADFTGFSLKNLTYAKIIIVLLGIFGVIITVIAWIVLYRSAAFSNKWAWAMAIAVSLTQINLRWIDGVWGFNPLAFQLFQPGVVRMNDGPWIVTVSIPVFAIYVLYLHRKSRQPQPGVYE
jgi:hypothetical protein